MLSITRLAWMLLVLALMGAVAGLFGPHERVWGIDLGATGTAVFGFTLWTVMIAIAHLDAPPVSIAELPSRHFMWNLFVLLIAWAVVAKTLRGPAPEVVELDERDLRMRRLADRAGDWALTLVVIAAVLLLAFVPPARLAWWLTPLVAANVLIGLLVGRSFVEHAFLVARYALERR